MLVYKRMSHHPITAPPDMGVEAALKLMRDEKIRRLPVVERKTNKLVGIVTEKDLLYASPSPATSLSIHEINYLLSKLKIEQVMTKKVITATEDMALEEAARVMVDNKIGGLPVMRGEALVGIITETDLFKVFIELFAGREEGVRLTMLVPEEKGMLAKITNKVSELGGNIVALGTFLGQDPTNRLLTIKVAGVGQIKLSNIMEELGLKVVDSRTCELGSKC